MGILELKGSFILETRNSRPEENQCLLNHTTLAKTPPRGHRSLLGRTATGLLPWSIGPLPHWLPSVRCCA